MRFVIIVLISFIVSGCGFKELKPIKRYELNPTSSQKTYIIIKESAITIPFIEKVNIPRNAKYLE